MEKKLESIIVEDMEHCLISGSPNVAVHHCFEGTANRRLSDRDKLLVPLSPFLHNEGGKPVAGVNCDVHHCKNMATLMHIIGEQAWIIQYLTDKYGIPFDDTKAEAIAAFRYVYGKSYI